MNLQAQNSSDGEAQGFPWWLAALAAIAIAIGIAIAVNDLYVQVFQTVIHGLWVTIGVTLTAFVLASALGLGIALMALSGSTWAQQTARFYTEIIRGVPILVLLFYIAFVGAPALTEAINFLATPLIKAGVMEPLLVREISLMWRAILALTIGYSAFISEVFRAGKDSSLVSVLGVQDITQLGKVYASGSFRFFETYSIVAYVYLILTVGLSLGLRRLEKRLRRNQIR